MQRSLTQLKNKRATGSALTVDTAESTGLPCFLVRSRSPQGVLHCCSCTAPHTFSCSHPLTIICYIRNLESFGTVPFIRLELDPQLLRPRSESYWAFVGLTGFIRGHWVGRSFQKKKKQNNNNTIGSYLTMPYASRCIQIRLNYHDKKCMPLLKQTNKINKKQNKQPSLYCGRPLVDHRIIARLGLEGI